VCVRVCVICAHVRVQCTHSLLVVLGMLSTVHYVIVSLNEWGDSDSFLELALHQAKCKALEAGLPFSHTAYFPTVFEASLEPYSELLADFSQQLVDMMIDSFQARCGGYRLSDEKQVIAVVVVFHFYC